MSDPHEHHRQLLFFIMSGISYCICLLQMVGIIVFCKIRGLLIIQKRYPRLILLEAVVSCFNLAIVYPANMSLQCNYPTISSEWWPYLSIGLTLFSLSICLIIESCRIWLIAYDLQYLHSSQNQRWKTEIDASYSEKDCISEIESNGVINSM